MVFFVTIVSLLTIVVGGAVVMCCYGEELEKQLHYFISPAVRSRSKIIVSFSQIMFTLPGMLALGEWMGWLMRDYRWPPPQILKFK